MRLNIFVAVLLFSAAMVRAEAVAPPADAASQAIVAASNAFAADLYGQLRSGRGAGGSPDNLFFSPLSIFNAVAMTEVGAGGDTRRQMRTVLRIDAIDPADVPAAMQRLQAVLQPPRGAAYELSVANAVWSARGYPFKAEYLGILETRYGGTIRELDFAQNEQAAQAINAWIEDMTRKKIKDLVSAGILNKMTRLVLTNAIYFKGDWHSAFVERDTRHEPFQLGGGQNVRVPMMHQTGRFGYAQTDAVQVLDMPYKGGDLSMVVVLPRTPGGLSEVEKAMTAEALSQWLAAPQPRQVAVALPKFTSTRQCNLKDVLTAMGIVDAFDPDKADFSGMVSHEKLVISDVLHKAFVDVNEKGTEAAAATAAVPSAVASVQPTEFRADQPFLFLIRHVRSGAVLFMGRVLDPSK